MMSDIFTKGHSVKTERGYTILEWAGPVVDSGRMKPFSVGPSGSCDRKWFGSLSEAEAYILTAPVLVVVRATIEAYVPVAASQREIEDWVRFSLHNNGSLSGSNPLVHREFVAHDVYIDDVRDVR